MAPRCGYCNSDRLAHRDGEEADVMLCEACGKSSLSVAPEVLGSSPQTPLRRSAVRRAPGEVPAGPTALGALVATVFIYLVLRNLPQSRVTDLFVARGWVPYVITVVAVWALLLLGARLLRLRREARALEFQLIASGSDGQLTPQDCPAALASLAQRSEDVEGGFLVARLERALHHFHSRRRVVEVVDHLAAESTADESRIDASYALVRVFVWVIPTLGFIGTVLGIGAAVGGFSATLEAASSLEAMKASIGSVTGGLGIAFDTTLLALVMSIVIMFPASAVQRIEENFLGQVDDYCAEELVRRMRDDAADAAAIDALARRLAEVMDKSVAGAT